MRLLHLSFGLLLGIPECPASTLYLTGTLHETPAPPSSSASGTFFFWLTDNTLTYRVSTRLLSGTDFELSAADYRLRTRAVEIPLPLLGHEVIGFSGCSLTFAAYPPFSVRLPDS